MGIRAKVAVTAGAVLGVVLVTALPAAAAQDAAIDSGHTAWVLVSAALVMFMTPGLAFFYGGLVRQKNVLSTIMHCFMALGIVTVVWTLIGHTLAFGPDVGHVVGKAGGWIGGLDFIGFKDVGDAPSPLAPGIPHTSYAIYQMMFAVITPALIAGTYAERIKFSSYMVFTTLWVLIVYAPVAHWVWGGGLLGPDGLGALDFAGGTVVHQNAGIAALAAALVLGKRKGYPQDPMVPHNVPFVVLGASILWFGWFGFNGGSALASGGLASLAFTNTHLATAAAIFGWVIPEAMQHKKVTTVGAATGAVAGLVAITPASGFVRPWSALVIGFFAAMVCYFAVGLKRRFGYDDALDVVGVHYVGGLIGALLTGVFASEVGLVYSGKADQFLKQLTASAITTVWSFVLSFALFKLIDWTMGLRVSEADEDVGLDLSQHGEAAYTMAGS